MDHSSVAASHGLLLATAPCLRDRAKLYAKMMLATTRNAVPMDDIMLNVSQP